MSCRVWAVQKIKTLLNEIPFGKVRPLTDSHAPDFEQWQAAIAPFVGQNWLETPWFFIETYKFRRIIEAVDYFQTGLDPFTHQKRESLRIMLDKIAQEATLFSKMLAEGWSEKHLEWLLLRDLWGNQVDLGLWSADDEFDHLHSSEAAQFSHLLVNDLTAVIPKITQAARLDFIIDNAGYELVGDLLLAAYVLTLNQAKRVHFHLKLHPTFVSDVTLADMDYVIGAFKDQSDSALTQFGEILQGFVDNGRLQLHNHPFWTSPHPLWALPDDLRQQLAQSDLILCKGDANYRRALGDLHWPYETPINQIINYLDCPILFLRTCKSEVFAGLENGRSAPLRQQDPSWDVNGKWGVVQLVDGVNSKK